MAPSQAIFQDEVHSRGFTIRYRAAGPTGGEVLLLIHGVLQSAARWADMGYLDALSDDRRVVAVDLLGHGDSDKPLDPAPYVLDGQLADLMAVLDAEGASTFDVWGYSGGAALATALANRHPERARSVVAGGIPPNLPPDARAAVTGTWIDALSAGDWDRFWQAFLPIDARTRALLQAANDPHAVAAWMQGIADSAEVAAAGPVPTFVYMGGKEVFLDMARATAEEIWAEFAVIEGRGHAGTFQDLPAVEPLVRSFLARARTT
jgi:pimeloyl-ACP methyl ester carboxylesterase